MPVFSKHQPPPLDSLESESYEVECSGPLYREGEKIRCQVTGKEVYLTREQMYTAVSHIRAGVPMLDTHMPERGIVGRTIDAHIDTSEQLAVMHVALRMYAPENCPPTKRLRAMMRQGLWNAMSLGWNVEDGQVRVVEVSGCAKGHYPIAQMTVVRASAQEAQVQAQVQYVGSSWDFSKVVVVPKVVVGSAERMKRLRAARLNAPRTHFSLSMSTETKDAEPTPMETKKEETEVGIAEVLRAAVTNAVVTPEVQAKIDAKAKDINERLALLEVLEAQNASARAAEKVTHDEKISSGACGQLITEFVKYSLGEGMQARASFKTPEELEEGQVDMWSTLCVGVCDMPEKNKDMYDLLEFSATRNIELRASLKTSEEKNGDLIAQTEGLEAQNAMHSRVEERVAKMLPALSGKDLPIVRTTSGGVYPRAAAGRVGPPTGTFTAGKRSSSAVAEAEAQAEAGEQDDSTAKPRAAKRQPTFWDELSSGWSTGGPLDISARVSNFEKFYTKVRA